MSTKTKLMVVSFIAAVSLGGLVPAAPAEEGLVHVNGQRLVQTDSGFENRDMERLWNRDVNRLVNRDAARLVDGAAGIVNVIVNPR